VATLAYSRTTSAAVVSTHSPGVSTPAPGVSTPSPVAPTLRSLLPPHPSDAPASSLLLPRTSLRTATGGSGAVANASRLRARNLVLPTNAPVVPTKASGLPGAASVVPTSELFPTSDRFSGRNLEPGGWAFASGASASRFWGGASSPGRRTRDSSVCGNDPEVKIEPSGVPGRSNGRPAGSRSVGASSSGGAPCNSFPRSDRISGPTGGSGVQWQSPRAPGASSGACANKPGRPTRASRHPTHNFFPKSDRSSGKVHGSGVASHSSRVPGQSPGVATRSLLSRRRPHVTHRGPEAERAVADRDLGNSHAALAHVTKQFFPTLLGLSVSVFQRDDFLRSVGARPDHHQSAESLVLEAHAEVHAIDPHVHVVAVGDRALLPRLVLVLPHAHEPRDRARRKTRRFLSEQHRQRLAEVAGRKPPKVEQRQELRDVLRAYLTSPRKRCIASTARAGSNGPSGPSTTSSHDSPPHLSQSSRPSNAPSPAGAPRFSPTSTLASPTP
jgi:hypothetical protein